MATRRSWAECRQLALVDNSGSKRDVTSTSPFHDCMDTGKSWTECRNIAIPNAARDLQLPSSGIQTRGVGGAIFSGFVEELGKKFGGTEKCYSVNNLGATGWITNTVVLSMKQQACATAINQALEAGSKGIGKYAAKRRGFHQAALGPVVQDGIKFFLSTYFQNSFEDNTFDVRAAGIDLCMKGIDHLTGDPGCTAPRKAAGKVAHTSVNGGEFNWSFDREPIFDNAGVCTNCVLSMVMEAADTYNKDGTVLQTEQ